MPADLLTRAELIASYSYGAVSDPPPAATDAPQPATGDPDTEVAAAIVEAQAAIKKALAAQAKDTDDDPADAKVETSLTSIAALLDTAAKDQAADSDKTPAPAAASVDLATPAGSAPPATAAPAGDPPPAVDDQGNIDPTVLCANEDCQHLASSHQDADAGANTGACTMAGCSCPGMQLSADVQDNAAADTESEFGASGRAAYAPALDAPAQTPAQPQEGAQEPAGAAVGDNAPPPLDGSDAMGPAFTAVLVVEGQPTADGRLIAPQALTWRVPPLPLMGQATAVHDPSGWDLNDPAVICGRIDTLERTPGENGSQLIIAHGFFLPNDDGMYFASIVEGMGRFGISGDVMPDEIAVEITDVDQDGFPLTMQDTIVRGTVLGATLTPFPAFDPCYITIDGAPDPQPIPVAVTAAGSLHLLSVEECSVCDPEHVVLVAAGGPLAPPARWFQDPGFKPGDGRLVEILSRRGDRDGQYACPLTVDEHGRVYGHIAPWDVCHTGFNGNCILAPHSAVDYAHFKRGEVLTAEGERVRVGVLTADSRHAPTQGVTASEALAHYDNTALAAADVTIGEDEYGIWVAGAVRPDATDEQVRKLRAASVSGDWRKLGGQLELVAALAVNHPGFPVAMVAAGGQEALVAAGASVMDTLKHPRRQDPPEPASAFERAMTPLLESSKQLARDRMAAIR